jgi:hypothetical protein
MLLDDEPRYACIRDSRHYARAEARPDHPEVPQAGILICEVPRDEGLHSKAKDFPERLSFELVAV